MDHLFFQKSGSESSNFFFWSTIFLEPFFLNQISRTRFLEPFLEKWLQNKWSNEYLLFVGQRIKCRLQHIERIYFLSIRTTYVFRTQDQVTAQCTLMYFSRISSDRKKSFCLLFSTVDVYSYSIANDFDIGFYCICLEILCQIAFSSLANTEEDEPQKTQT